MKDGSMFTFAAFYLEKEYGLEHSFFELSFADGVRRYALMAVLHIELTPENVEAILQTTARHRRHSSFVEMRNRNRFIAAAPVRDGANSF